jgi:hypothetical protein
VVDYEVRTCVAERFGEAAHKRLQEPIQIARACAKADRFEMAAECKKEAIRVRPRNRGSPTA